MIYSIFTARRNRTICRLGGYCYIHLTTRTNAVFPGFFDPLAPAAIIYNSITFVMNYPVLISSDFSVFAFPVILERYPFSSKGVRHGSTLGGARYIHLTMRTSHAKRTLLEYQKSRQISRPNLACHASLLLFTRCANSNDSFLITRLQISHFPASRSAL